jgi:Tfp pilus assembly protein FimV
MKTTIFRSSGLAIVLAGALMAPAPMQAQRDATTRAYTVRSGDTFYSIAATYLGDRNRWREISSLNPYVSTSQSLAVGSTIQIPWNVATGQVGFGSLRDATVLTFQPRASANTKERSMFFDAPVGGFVIRDRRYVMTDSGVPAAVYEAMSAPFVGTPAVLAASGRCVSVRPMASEARGVQLSEPITIRVPGGVATAGSRWLLVRQGPVLSGVGQIMIPTAVVRLTSDSPAGADASAEIVGQFGAVSCADRVLAVPDAPAHEATPTPVTDGVRGRIAWVENESLLPSIQHALILDIGSASGVELGDRITIYDADGRMVVAGADVVRVEERSATVLVARQSLPSLAAGLPVRVTEKLP